MTKISEALAKKLQSSPKAEANVIVRIDGQPDAVAKRIEVRGITIRHKFTLTPSLALKGPASAILELVTESWVLSVEEDKPVHTME